MNKTSVKWAVQIPGLDRRSGFDKTLTPGPLTPYWPPYWSPYWPPIKSMEKWKLRKPGTINGTRFKFINKFSLPETCKMADALQISFYCFVEVLLTENRAQNKIEYHQILLSYALGNEAKRNADKWTGSRKDCDGLFRATNTRVNLNRKTNFIR